MPVWLLQLYLAVVLFWWCGLGLGFFMQTLAHALWFVAFGSPSLAWMHYPLVWLQVYSGLQAFVCRCCGQSQGLSRSSAQRWPGEPSA